MQLSKVYLIHERPHQKDSPSRPPQQVLRRQRIGQRLRIQSRSLVGDGKHQLRARILQAHPDVLGGIVFIPVQHGVHRSLPHRHRDVEALVLVHTGLFGQLVRGGFHLAHALHRGVQRKTAPACLRCAQIVWNHPAESVARTRISAAHLSPRQPARSFFAQIRLCQARTAPSPESNRSPQRTRRVSFQRAKAAWAVYTLFMQPRTSTRVSLTALLGTPVTDAKGHLRGRLKDIAVATGPDAGKVAGLVLKTRAGLSLVPSQDVMETPAGTLELRSAGDLRPLNDQGNYLYLQQDLVDRQIIDVHGRKVVRANDVDLEWLGHGAAHLLRVAEVEVGLRGAFRRIFKGVLPRARLESLSRRFGARAIPWQFVDVIEVDPARRVKLRIEYERLAEMHPSDLAEILEDLAPAEREAVFTALDEEVAAEALEEVDPKLQKSLLETLDEEKAADIVEEMDPGAAADLLAELSEEQSDAILEEMEPEERHEVEELLEFDERTAAGCMTTDFIHLGMEATVAHAVQALRSFDGDPESVSEVYLLDEKRVLRGSIPLARLVMAQPETRLAVLAEPRVLSCPAGLHQNELAEMFDKYNLRALPVVDPQGRMVGVVQADQVISFLREKI